MQGVQSYATNSDCASELCHVISHTLLCVCVHVHACVKIHRVFVDLPSHLYRLKGEMNCSQIYCVC